MLVSQITRNDVAEFINLDDPGNLDAESERMLDLALKSAESYVKNYTGLSYHEMDQHEELAIAVLVLCQDAYDNRSYESSSNGNKSGSVNRIVQSILDMHSKNLL